MEVYLSYEEFRTGGDAHDPEDRWTSYDDEYINFTPKNLFLNRDSAGIWVETIETNETFNRGDTAHLVVIRYGSGNTFIHTEGNWVIDGLYKDPKVATQIAENIRSDAEYEEELGFYNRWGKNSNTMTKPKEPKGYPNYPGVTSYWAGYKPWDGYFESFGGAEVYTLLVQ